MKEVLAFFMGLTTILGIVLFWLFGFAFIFAFPVMWCWNYVIPAISNLPRIDYWQAFAIYVLCGFLFKQTRTVEKEKEKEKEKQ